MKEPWVTDKWHVSKFNFEGMRESLNIPDLVRISDCTLRDGEQQAGVVFNKEEKIEIGKLLDGLQIYEIEAGTPMVSVEDREAIEGMLALGLKSKISVLIRARKDDIDLAKDIGVWGVRISFPIGDLQRKYKMTLPDDEYIKTSLEMTSYAKEKGLEVIFSPYDTTRCDLQFLRQVLSEISKRSFADRFRLVDTTGAATPHAIRFLVKEMKEAGNGIPIEVHCHNDFGLAVANTLAGVEAGAEYASTTINGLGERSGNAPTEEVGVALRVLYNIDTGMDLKKIPEVSRIVEKYSGIRVQAHKAVVGTNSFSHESGMVVAGVLKYPFTGESYSPELLGRVRKIVLGKKSGLTSIKAKLEDLGIEASDNQEKAILEKVKEISTLDKKAISDKEFKGIVKEILRHKSEV